MARPVYRIAALLGALLLVALALVALGPSLRRTATSGGSAPATAADLELIGRQLADLRQLIERAAPAQQQLQQLQRPPGDGEVDHSEALLCFPHDSNHLDRLKKLNELEPHNLQHVYERLQYWTPGSREQRKLPNSGAQYLVFFPDCGGFNNIRMGFEVAVIYAWVTRRTLVMPPATGWYLLDWGPIARDLPASPNEVSQFSDFFDMRALEGAVPVISTGDFLREAGPRLGAPDKFMRLAAPGSAWTPQALQDWIRWLVRAERRPLARAAPWGPIANMLAWPDHSAVRRAGLPQLERLVAGRTVREYPAELRDALVLSLPSCPNCDCVPEGEEARLAELTYRYLGQVGTAVAFADAALAQSLRAMLRDQVHYVPRVFEVAARVIARLGIYRFSSMHIRRNDLQYKEVFLPAAQILRNTEELLEPGEPLYIATDEKDPAFLDPLRAAHPVFQWADFFTERGGNVLTGVDIPRKLIGPIEQVICAGGRVFFGTNLSTFSSYINRLRGYMQAPVRNILYHTATNPKAKFRLNPPAPVQHYGSDYMSEDASLWTKLIEQAPRPLTIDE